VVAPSALGAPDWYYNFYYTAGLSLAALAGTVIVGHLILSEQTFSHRILCWAPLVLMGEISYGIYLWHATVFHSVQYVLSGFPDPVVWVIELAASLLIAWLSWQLMESPLRELRRRLHRRSSELKAGDRTERISPDLGVLPTRRP
jgi:peptidoglycan/LPS O-acetylase OafA/YrhL